MSHCVKRSYGHEPNLYIICKYAEQTQVVFHCQADVLCSKSLFFEMLLKYCKGIVTLNQVAPSNDIESFLTALYMNATNLAWENLFTLAHLARYFQSFDLMELLDNYIVRAFKSPFVVILLEEQDLIDSVLSHVLQYSEVFIMSLIKLPYIFAYHVIFENATPYLEALEMLNVVANVDHAYFLRQYARAMSEMARAVPITSHLNCFMAWKKKVSTLMP